MVKIGDISIQNPWWKYGVDFDRYDPDFTKFTGPIFFDRVEIPLNTGNIYIIRGSRRVGKTLYLKHIIKKLINEGVDPRRVLYLSLDYFTSRRELRSAINYFVNTNRDARELYIFLDEVTTIRDWELELKYLSDIGVIRKAVVVATGSSGVSLRRRVDLLPGRGVEGNEYYMKPLSFREFVQSTVDYIGSIVEEREFRDALDIVKKIMLREDVYVELDWDIQKIYDVANVLAPYIHELEYLFNIYLVTGGFPQSINSFFNRFEERRIDPILVEVFVRNVVGDISKLGKQEIYAKRILKEILSRYGTRYSIRDLASAAELNHITVNEYLEILAESFILTILYSYDLDMGKIKYKGDKKIYLQDPFIYYSISSYITGRDINEVIEDMIGDEANLGRIIEGIVCTHLASYMEKPLLKVIHTFLWFYYNRGREVDFIIKTDRGFTSIEVKYRRNVDYRDIHKHPKINKHIILSKEDIDLKEDTLIITTPIFLLLLRKNRYIL